MSTESRLTPPRPQDPPPPAATSREGAPAPGTPPAIDRRQFLLAAGAVGATLPLGGAGHALAPGLLGRAAPSSDGAADPKRRVLALARQGSFYVNINRVMAEVNDGVPLSTPGVFPPGHVIIDQAYVQYQIPAEREYAYPIILTHGGGHHGGFYEETPDGREGYFTYFARRGFAVYVLDDVNRGRSGYDIQTIDAVKLGLEPPSAIPRINKYSQERAWTFFGIGPEFGVAYPGTQFPLEAFEHYSAQLVPAWRDQPVEDPKNRAAFVALFDRLGPSILVTWSQSGPFGWAAGSQRPELVRGIIALEPGGIPASTPASDLARLARVPVVVVASEHAASPLASYQAIVDTLRAAGGRAELLHLPAEGIFGNSHVMAIERNNLEIAELALERLTRLAGIRPSRRRGRA
jgi:pimeloyl-ACP methyl ester carboxylesterase